jgi:hypothetical protein
MAVAVASKKRIRLSDMREEESKGCQVLCLLRDTPILGLSSRKEIYFKVMLRPLGESTG